MSSSVHVDNKGIDVSILPKGPTQRLDGTTFSGGGIYSLNFKQPIIKNFV